jgi:hypothetical protein
MTTTVTITHGGPDVHDVLVTPTGSTSLSEPARLTKEGDSLTVYFWGTGSYTITEVEKEKQQ